jgi:hypothetical protein
LKVFKALGGNGNELPTKREYDDTFYGWHSTETLVPTKTSGNTAVYNAVSTDGGDGIITYTYNPATGTLNQDIKSLVSGNEYNYTITLGSDGSAVFTNNKTGKIDQILKLLSDGHTMSVCDQYGNEVDTLTGYTLSYDPVAKLESAAKRLKKSVVAFDTEFKGEHIKGVAENVPLWASEALDVAGKASRKVGRAAKAVL